MSTSICEVLRFVHANRAQLQVKSVEPLSLHGIEYRGCKYESKDRNGTLEDILAREVKPTKCKGPISISLITSQCTGQIKVRRYTYKSILQGTFCCISVRFPCGSRLLLFEALRTLLIATRLLVKATGSWINTRLLTKASWTWISISCWWWQSYSWRYSLSAAETEVF